jgi:hypothetical protein
MILAQTHAAVGETSIHIDPNKSCEIFDDGETKKEKTKAATRTADHYVDRG